MVGIFLEYTYTSILGFLEKLLLGLFGLVEIVNSDDINNKYALVLVFLFTFTSVTLYFIAKEDVKKIYHKAFKGTKKRPKSSKNKKRNSKSKTQKNITSTKSTTSKKGNRKNKVETKTTRSGATRINTKKQIVTPGTKRR